MPIQRIVCFKFKEAATDSDRQAHMDAFAKLKDAISQITTYTGGYGLSGDLGSSPRYDTLHHMTFASMEDVNIYFDHAAHQQFIADHKHCWGEVLVLNADITE